MSNIPHDLPAMSRHCCDHEPRPAESMLDVAAYRRVMWVALILNAFMFEVELAAGFWADSIDSAGDALN